jgi:hypothetical protein
LTSTRIDKTRLERFEFKPVKKLRSSLKDKPKIREDLKKDFKGTLQAQGITVDDDFLQTVHREWRSQIKTDIQRVADERGSETWYLKKVLEGKPITVRVTVDLKEGKNRKKLLEDEE